MVVAMSASLHLWLPRTLVPSCLSGRGDYPKDKGNYHLIGLHLPAFMRLRGPMYVTTGPR